MRVMVIASGNYAKYLPSGSRGGRVTVEVEDQSTLRGLMEQLSFPDQMGRYVQVNGQRVDDLEQVLSHGDEIRFVLPLAGG